MVFLRISTPCNSRVVGSWQWASSLPSRPEETGSRPHLAFPCTIPVVTFSRSPELRTVLVFRGVCQPVTVVVAPCGERCRRSTPVSIHATHRQQSPPTSKLQVHIKRPPNTVGITSVIFFLSATFRLRTAIFQSNSQPAFDFCDQMTRPPKPRLQNFSSRQAPEE